MTQQKVIGYIRVSTEDQAREGWSLSAQSEKIELYCKLHNLHLVEIISDEGISACNVKGRPGMMRLLEITTTARTSDVDAIVIVKLDRLFRNAAEALKYSESWRKRGVQLHSIHEGVQTDGAAGKMFFSLLAVFAEFERDQISERTIAGLDKRKSSGLKLGGEPQFGYTADENGYLILSPGEQDVILKMRQYRDAGLSYRNIANELNAENLRNRSGRPWNAVVVRNVLTRKPSDL